MKRHLIAKLLLHLKKSVSESIGNVKIAIGGNSSLYAIAAQNWSKTAKNYWRDAGTHPSSCNVFGIATFSRLIYFTFFALVRQLYLLTEDVAVNPVLYYHNTD